MFPVIPKLPPILTPLLSVADPVTNKLEFIPTFPFNSDVVPTTNEPPALTLVPTVVLSTVKMLVDLLYVKSASS